MFAVFVAILLVQAVVAYRREASACDHDDLPETLDASMTCWARSGREDKDFTRLLEFCNVSTNKQSCQGTCNVCHVTSRSFLHDILSRHNKLRNRNNAPSLEWDMDLQSSAEDHCERLVANDMDPESVSEEFTFPAKTGRNVYVGVNIRNIKHIGSRAVDLWYGTKDSYDFKTGKFSEDARSFTQLVWKSTGRVGCSYVTGLKEGAGGEPVDNMVYVCCHYKSRGNVKGKFLMNVLK